MTYPYGALAMLCFALTYLPTRNACRTLTRRINAQSNTRFLSPSVFLIFYFSFFLSDLSPSLSSLSVVSPAFFHVSLYLIRFIASTIFGLFARWLCARTHLDTPLVSCMISVDYPFFRYIRAHKYMYVVWALPPGSMNAISLLCTDGGCVIRFIESSALVSVSCPKNNVVAIT